MLTDIGLGKDSETPLHKDITLPYGIDPWVIPIDHQGPLVVDRLSYELSEALHD